MLEELKKAIKTKWSMTDTEMIRKAITQWKRRLHVVSKQ